MKRFDKLEEWLGGSLFLLMFVILIAQIFARRFYPLAWSEELARLIFVYTAMLGISMGIRSQQHVFIDFIATRLPEKVAKALFSIAQVMIFICIMLFLHFGIYLTEKAAGVSNDLIVTLGISTKWMYLALPLGAVLMLIRFLQVQRERYLKEETHIPAWVYVLATVIFLAILFVWPDWYKALQISNYVRLGDNAVYVVLGVWLVIMFLGVPVGWSLMIATGFDEMLLPAVVHKIDGAIGSTYNINAPRARKIITLAAAGQNEEALRYQHESNDLITALLANGLYPTIKQLLVLEGCDAGAFLSRKPMASANEMQIARAKEIHERYIKNMPLD